jgi:hypothetical protein
MNGLPLKPGWNSSCETPLAPLLPKRLEKAASAPSRLERREDLDIFLLKVEMRSNMFG